MKHQKGLEPISKDKFRALQENGNRRENQTCDGPYEGLAKHGNQADGCHQYERLKLSDIRLQEDAIHRGHPSPDSLVQHFLQNDIREIGTLQEMCKGSDEVVDGTHSLSNTYLTPNVKALTDSPGLRIQNVDTDGSDETRNTTNTKSSNHRICCIIVIAVATIAVLVAGSVTAAVVMLKKNTNNIPGNDASSEVVDCGQYNNRLLNIKYTVSKGASTFNSSLDVTCEPGLVHANWSNTSVRCSAEGVWEGTPDCLIPGLIEFSEADYEFTIGENGSFRCDVSQYPNWQHVRIRNDETKVVVFDAVNRTGELLILSLIESSYTLQNDGLVINVKFNEVNCSVEGMYFGQLIVGDYADIRVAKTSVYVRANSSKPKIMIPYKVLGTRDYVVNCSGNVGRNSSGTFGQIVLESRENRSGNFITEHRGNITQCDGAALLTVNRTADRYYRSREFRCKVEDPEGNTLYSEVVYHPVIDSFDINVFGYRLSSIGLPSGGLLEVNIPGFCDWGPVRYISRYNWRDPLDNLICQHFGYVNESVVQPTTKQGSYPDACMIISTCPTDALKTIHDIADKCSIEYGPPGPDYDNLYKEINCIPVQLVDGSTPLQGRIEAGLFGHLSVICSLGFDARAANVTCASLGYRRGATKLWKNSYFGDGSRYIYKRNITCLGDELSLELCRHSDTDIPGCDRYNVVGIECEGDIIKIEPLFATRPYEGPVVGYHGDLRYDIVGNVSKNTAQTLCAMLGYGRPTPGRSLYYFKKDVNCTGTEKSISECVGDIEYCVERRYYYCEGKTETYQHVTLFCSAYKIQGLRLGPNGTLLMEINGREWGSCTDDFSTQTAQSACRIMGYSGNVTFAAQKAGTDDVEITGSLVCSANATTVENCELEHQFSYRPYRLDFACNQYVLLSCGNSNTGR